MNDNVNDNINDDNNDNHNEEPAINMPFHNSVLAELFVDGEWPYPYLLLARLILLTLADPNRPDWSHSIITNTHNNVKDSSLPSPSPKDDKIIIRNKTHDNTTTLYSPPSK